MKAQIAASHPGKMGDALYTLPVLNYIYNATGQKIDFYTSSYCEPMRRLFEYQSCINKFIIPNDYIIDNFGCGIQPWKMPIPEDEYKKIFQLGFRYTPDRMLHQFIAHQIGIDIPLEIKYEYPDHNFMEPMVGDYICIAPRGNTTFVETFNELTKHKTCVVIGARGEYTGYGIDATGNDMLETLSCLAHSKGFVGLMSSQLVLANGFDIPRISLNGYQSDMRHAINTHRNFYMSESATLDDVITILDKG